jgi:hypothetical protein
VNVEIDGYRRTDFEEVPCMPGTTVYRKPRLTAGFVPLGTRYRWRYTPDVHYVLITDGRGTWPYSRELCMHTEGPTYSDAHPYIKFSSKA